MANDDAKKSPNIPNIGLKVDDVEKIVEKILADHAGDENLTEKEIDALMKELQKYLPVDQIDIILKKLRTQLRD